MPRVKDVEVKCVHLPTLAEAHAQVRYFLQQYVTELDEVDTQFNPNPEYNATRDASRDVDSYMVTIRIHVSVVILPSAGHSFKC